MMNEFIEPPSDEAEAFLSALRAEGNKNTDGKCPDCKGHGSWTDENGKAVLCHCLKNQMWREKYATAGIPPKYFGKTLDEKWNLKQDAWGEDLKPADLNRKNMVKQLLNKYIKALPAICAGIPLKIIPTHGMTINVTNILLVGGAGSGKSLIAACAAQEAIQQTLTVQYFDYSELYHDLSSFDSRDKQDIIANAFEHKDFIVIDGLTYYEIRNPVLAVQLDRVARARQRSGKPTLITSYRDYDKIDAGPGWKSMLSTSFTFRLPTQLPPRQINA